MTVADLIYGLFTLFNGVRVVSYLPQIIKIARDRNGATVISYATWGSWTAANGSAGLYAAVNLRDPMLATLNLLNAACCLVVIGLTAWQRYRFQQARARGSGPGAVSEAGSEPSSAF